ncbi:TetR/AcrR family transcriptional regulator [Pedobacter sp. MW01-1-1]|uniref:TetR/AcrR family transcriptional regulator n=1 Tax=Pedobacter sp. MW01-1-1 TaxID=3383027 RepID=UPI003FEEBB84
MGSKERILRLKDETRTKILDAALNIVQTEGWQALSMRKIADQIEYTAPIIYEYFSNKDGILLELTRRGYLLLAKDIRNARDQHENAADKMEAMWVAYWDFAFKHKEFYQLMYGVEMVCCTVQKTMPEAETISHMLGDVIESLFDKKPVSEDDICKKYYTYWSIIHGLISINLVRPYGRTTNELNQQILRDAIKGITLSINT